MMGCNTLVPQLYWFKRFRTSIPVMFVVSILINIGMWFERFIIIVLSLNRDYLPSSWGPTSGRPSSTSASSPGPSACSSALFLLFMRWLPMVAMAEVKGTMPQADPHFGHDDEAHAPEPHAPPAAGGLVPEGAE